MVNPICIVLALFAASAAPLAAEQPAAANSFSLRWEELAPLVVGNRIDTVLTDGRHVKGKVLAVREDALALDNRPEVPRALVSVLRITKTTGTWRVVGTSVGVGFGLAVGIPVGAITGDVGKGVAIVATGAGLGYLGGHPADHQVRTIKVIR